MSETQKRKKLIRIAARPGSDGGYGFSSMNFAFVSNPADGRRQVSASMTCREYVNRTVWGAYNGEDTGQHNPDSDPPFDFTRLRLLICYDKGDLAEFKRKLFNGKAALNLYEAINGWKRSTITTVVHSAYKNAWLLTGPQEWLSQPQLLSLATWIMRLAAFKGPLNTESFDALEKSLYDIQRGENNGSSDTNTYCKKFWNRSYILVKYHKEIFQMDMNEAWSPHEGNNFGIYSGFLSFCDKSAKYSNKVVAAQKRFSELCEKHLPRKNPLIPMR